MEFTKGDRVKYGPGLIGVQRQGKVGVITAVYPSLPAQGGPRLDIQFPDGSVDYGISIGQIEKE